MKNQFVRTNRLFLFSLKKDRLKILSWIFGSLTFIFIAIYAYVELYSDASERQLMAFAMSNPAMEAIFGPVIGGDNYTIGAMYSHTMTILTLCLFAIMSILLVVRNTRAEEEDGILELLRALPVGQLSHTSAALLLLLLSNVSLSLLTIGVIYPLGDISITLEGSILTGVIYGTIGLFFGVVALLMGQLTSNSRNAMIWSFGLLGIAYILRIIGDSNQSFLSWLSPLGLLYRTEPFVKNNWEPVISLLIATCLLLALALFLQQKRDVGAGLLAEKPGKRHATPSLKTTFGFAMRLLSTPLLIWLVGLVILGISYGSVIGDVEGMLKDNDLIKEMLSLQSGANLVDQFLTIIIGLLSIFVTIPATQTLLRLKTEENKGRMDELLAGNRTRRGILGTFLWIAFLTSIVMQTGQLLAIGVSAVVMNFDVSILSVFKAGIAYLPAIWLVLGLTVFLYGCFPKFTNMVWGYLGFAFIVLYFSGLFDMPEWLMGLSSFYHIPQISQEPYHWGTALVLSGIAAGFSILGFLGFKQRDING